MKQFFAVFFFFAADNLKIKDCFYFTLDSEMLFTFVKTEINLRQ